MQDNFIEYRPRLGIQESSQHRGLQLRAFEVMGKQLGTEIHTNADIARICRDGVQPELVSVLYSFGFDKGELDWVVAPRTLSHRKSKNDKLTADESGRLLRVASIYSLAQTVFANQEKAMKWLHKTRRSFEGMNAIDLMKTEAGARLVEEQLLQLDSGYFA